MYLLETSAWIEYLRQTSSPTHEAVHNLLEGTDFALTEPVMMELLAGETNERRRYHLENRLDACPMLPVDPELDYRDAARIHRVVRRQGRTVRGLLDCLIAAVALRTGATLLHNDGAFDAIASCVPLNTMRAT